MAGREGQVLGGKMMTPAGSASSSLLSRSSVFSPLACPISAASHSTPAMLVVLVTCFSELP